MAGAPTHSNLAPLSRSNSIDDVDEDDDKSALPLARFGPPLLVISADDDILRPLTKSQTDFIFSLQPGLFRMRHTPQAHLLAAKLKLPSIAI